MSVETHRIEIKAEVEDCTDPGVSSAQKKMSAFDRVNEKTQQRLEKMNRSKFQVALNAVDRASAVVQKVSSTLKRFTSKAWNVTMKAVDMVTAPVRGIFKLFTNPLFQIGAAIGVTIGVKDTIDTYVGFEKSMSKVKGLLETTSQDIAGDMGMLSEKAREMGKATTKSAAEAADAMGYMALAGWDAGTIMTAIEPVLRLSEAGQMDLARASDLVTDSMSSLGLGAGELTGYLDKVAKTAATSNTDVDRLMEAFMECGGTVNRLNMPLSEAAGLLGVLANRGVKGSEAGTALNSILVNLTATSGQAADAMAELGLSAFDGEGKFRGYATVLKDLYNKTKDMDDEQKNYYLSSIGMKMRMSDLQKFLAGVSEEYDTLTAGIEDSDGALLKMAETMNDNLYGDFKAFTSALDEVKIAFTDKLQPNLRAFVQWFTGKMPDLQKAAGDLADGINEKIRWLQETIADFTGSDEWAGADLWGKLAIAWDRIVAEPFGEWWDGTGRQWMTDKVSDIGRALGGGITAGLLGLLGIDLSGAAKDGKSLGASFVTGFREGFDTEKITAALKEWASDHKGVVAGLGVIVGGKLLGGLARWLSTAKGLFGRGGAAGGGSIGGLSTMTTATMQVNAGVVNVYGMNAGAAARGAAGMAGSAVRSLTGGVPALAGSGAAGRTLVGTAPGGAVGAGLASVGTALGSGATTATGAAMVGGGAVLGGAAGGVTLISAGTDIYKAVKTEDEKEREAYMRSADWKSKGALSGAALGASIGVWFGGVGAIPGALIGAGIGGIAGMFAGNNEIKKYEEEMKRAEEEMRLAEEEARRLIIEQEQARYSSQRLKDAVQDLADGYITADQFMAMKQAEIMAGIEKRFGTIQLSMGEIQSMAKGIAFSGMEESMSAFTAASVRASDELEQLKGTAVSLERLNWKAGLGLASTGPEEYKQGVDAFLAGARQYAESRHFEIATATSLLLGDRADMSELDAVFANIQTDIDALGAQLTAKFEVEGELDTAGIADLQNQIMDKMRTLTDAEYEGRLDLLKITFGGGQLSSESFAQLQSELEKTAQEAKEGLQNAYAAAFTGLRIQLDTNVIDKNTFNERFRVLEEAYKSEMSGVDQRISDFLADEIGEKFGLSAGELTQGMQESMKLGISPASWTPRQAGAFLGLDSLEDGAGAQLAVMVNRLAQGLPGLWGLSGEKGGFVSWDGYGIGSYGGFLRTNMGAGQFAENGVPQPAGNDRNSQGGPGGPRIDAAHAWGGIMDKPHIGLVAEAGPESIIPLSPSKRERGLALWEETGALLGAIPYNHGGIAGNTAGMEPLPTATAGGAAAYPTVQVTIPGLPPITVNVEQQDDPERIVSVVKERLRDMVDDIGGALAEQLAPVFANMPKRGGA